MPKAKPFLVDFDSIGKQYGKPDIERLGIFIENPYLNGKGYKSPFARTFLNYRYYTNEIRMFYMYTLYLMYRAAQVQRKEYAGRGQEE